MAARAIYLLLAAILAASVSSSLARGLLQEPSASTATKVGVWRDESEPLKGFETSVWRRVNELAGLNASPVELPTLDERFSSLESGATDWVVAAISVTPERAQRVDFALPYYYSAGAALYAPDGNAPAGITSWEGVRGQKLAVIQDYYANDVLEKQYGAILVPAATPAEATAKVTGGEAVAYMADSTNLIQEGGLKIVPSLTPLLPLPYGIAVKKGNAELASKISDALVKMATGGSSSDLARLEQEYFIANGAAPNPDLAALLADPTSKTTPLGTAVSG